MSYLKEFKSLIERLVDDLKRAMIFLDMTKGSTTQFSNSTPLVRDHTLLESAKYRFIALSIGFIIKSYPKVHIRKDSSTVSSEASNLYK